jgi:uncharacterized delta-60 repeat protein
MIGETWSSDGWSHVVVFFLKRVLAHWKLSDAHTGECGLRERRTRVWALAGAIALLSAGRGAEAQPGSRDPSFTFSTDQVYLVSGIALTSDGKIVTGGTYTGQRGARLVQLDTYGNLDPRFQAPTIGPASSSIGSLIVQPDGRIVIGGYFNNYNGRLCQSILRLQPSGLVDASFDPAAGVDGSVWNLALQPDGKLLVSGFFNSMNGVPRTNLARLNPDGSLDASFAPVFQGSNPGPVVPQSDNRILLGGPLILANGTLVHLARLNPDGSLDESFAPALQQGDEVAAIALLPDGRILLGGRFSPIGPGANSDASLLTLRINSDGSLDPGFIPAVTKIDYTEQCRYGFVGKDDILGLAVQNDGKVVIHGAFSVVNGFACRNLARLNPDGTLDGDFDPGTGADGQTTESLLDAQGNILIDGCFTHFGGVAAPLFLRVLGGEPPPGAPRFKSQPLVDLFAAGRAVTLTPLISAFPAADYQWKFNGQDLPSATHSTLLLTNLGPANAGTYQLRVTNSLGVTNSQTTVLGAPTIVTQPEPQTIRQGEDATFSVVVTNLLPIALQWQLDNNNLAGATNATLFLQSPTAAQAGHYSVVASNALGSITSVPASLTLLPATAPEILVQPLSQMVEEGAPASFQVVATNYLPLSYQWQFQPTDIPGANQSVLRIPAVRASDAGAYRAVVSSEFLSVTSAVATLSVKAVDFVPGPGVVTNLDQASLEAALQLGVPVTFGVNGIIPFTHPLLIGTNAIVDATGRSITLDGQNATRHFTVTNGATLRLINLALINGRAIGSHGHTNQAGEAAFGGSIYSSGGNVEVIGCQFANNEVAGGPGGPSAPPAGGSLTTTGGPAYGGAIFSSSGSLLATNAVFINNACAGGQGVASPDGYNGGGGDAYGGAVYSTNGTLVLVGVTCKNNAAIGGEDTEGRPGSSGGGARGGALAEMGTSAVLSNCVFASNHVVSADNTVPPPPIAPRYADAEGGALFHASGVMKISGTLFANNYAQGGPGLPWHGGIGAMGGFGNGGAVFHKSGSLEVMDCAFASNQVSGGWIIGSPVSGRGGAGLGAGICSRGDLTLVNCTVAGNQARGGDCLGWLGSGGMAYGGGVYSAASATFVNVTVAGNSVQVGAGFDSYFPTGAAGGAVAFTNTAPFMTNTILFCLPGQTNVFGPIIDGGHNICSDGSARFSAPSSLNDLDPLLGPLADNGGSTPTMALLPGSTAIDAGDDSVCPPTDQRGVPRPQGVTCDIGAFELAPTLRVTYPQAGMATLDYAFRAGVTNQISASTNLLDWLLIGTRVSDANGMFQFEDANAVHYSNRFYQVRP